MRCYGDYMREIGVRELKARLSHALRTVEQGAHLRVTVRGRPVADLVPSGSRLEHDPLRDLAAQGRIALPAQSRPRRAPRLAQGAGSASDLVLAERDDER